MTASPFDLTGRLAVVTGASRGIGLAMARALATAGADVVGVSASMDSRAHDVDRAVSAHGRSFVGVTADLARRGAVDEVVAAVDYLDRPVDVLVNNAGTIHRQPATDYDVDAWDRVVEVNMTAPFLLSQRIGRRMVDRGRGKIIFTASLLTFQGGINVAAYAASKSAVAGIVRGLSNEWAPRGVTVNAIAPGYIATDNTAALRDDPDRDRAILERIPAGRWGAPDDIGGATVFLASAASDYVTGTVIPVDGGWLAR